MAAIFPGFSHALTHYDLVTQYDDIWFYIGSSNALLPDGTKPLPNPMLPYRWSPLAFSRGHFHKVCSRYHSLQSV